MKFIATIALLFVAVASAQPLAAPASDAMASKINVISKRTCGTLKGEELTICQDACIAICDAASAGFAAKLCAEACKAGPL